MRYITNDIKNLFYSHIAHMRFINIFLSNVKKLDIDIGLRTKILIELSDLLVHDYVYDEDGKFEKTALSFGEIGKEIYEELMTVWNYQISFCGQVGIDLDKLGQCFDILNRAEEKLGNI